MQYPAKLTPEDGGFVVSFRDVPEAHTQGDTLEEALAHAVTALETGMLIYITEGRPIPPATPAKRGERLVPLPGLSAAKVALWRTFLASGMSKLALAKKLGWHPPQVMRAFDLRHASKFEQLDQVAALLGKRLDVDLRDAAD